MELKKQSIEILNISDNIKSILKDKKINTLEKLCKKTKFELKNYDLTQNEVKKIEVELQLKGLDLKQ